MRPGYIYFAETSAPHIKVGRALSHISIERKEATYRRLDPGFIIRHTFDCPDVVVEEKRVLNMLRLVAGTEVKGAGRECFAMSVKDAVAVATAAPASQEDLARQIIMSHPLAGSTVRDIIAASDVPSDSSQQASLASLTSFTTGTVALCGLGIILASGGHDQGLASDSYATVVDSKALTRRIPQLRKLSVELSGLALY